MGVHLTGVHLTSMHLTGVCLMGAYLMGVYLTGVHLMRVSHRRDLTGVHLIGVHLTGMHLTGVYLIGVHFTGVHHRMQPFLLSRTYIFAAGGSPARGPRPKATLDTKLVRRYRAGQRAATRVRTRWSSLLQEAISRC